MGSGASCVLSKKSNDGSTGVGVYAGKNRSVKLDEARDLVQLFQLSHVLDGDMDENVQKVMRAFATTRENSRSSDPLCDDQKRVLAKLALGLRDGPPASPIVIANTNSGLSAGWAYRIDPTRDFQFNGPASELVKKWSAGAPPPDLGDQHEAPQDAQSRLFAVPLMQSKDADANAGTASYSEPVEHDPEALGSVRCKHIQELVRRGVVPTGQKNEKEVAVVCCLKTESWIIVTTELSTEADDDDCEWSGWNVKSNGRSSAQQEDLAERTGALIDGLIGRGYSVFEIEKPFVRRDGYQHAGAPVAWSLVVANYGLKPRRHEVDHLTGDGAFAKFAERAVKKLRTDGAVEFPELRKLRRILTEVSNAPENLQTHGINANALKARGLH